MTREELSAGLGCPVDFVASLEAERIIAVHDGAYEEATIERVRVCWGLHEDLGVNLPGLDVVLHLLERLEAERRLHRDALRQLRALEG